jgi:hypothetical protein
MFDRLRSMLQPKSGKADSYEQFVAAFLKECKRQGHEPSSYDDQTRSFVFRAGPEPNLYPPRYRALGFPSGSIWDKLRERAVP